MPTDDASASQARPRAPDAELGSLLDAQFRTSVPASLRVVGGIYVVLSGTLFLQFNLSVAATSAIWALTAGLGLAAFGLGTWVRRASPSQRWLTNSTAVVACLFVVHAVALAWAFQDPGQATYLFALLASGGYFLLPRRALIAFFVTATAAWFAAAYDLGLPLRDASTGYILAGIFVGLVANFSRQRHIRALALGRTELLGTLHSSEQRFQALAETAQDAILLVDAEGRVTYLNTAGLTLFGLSAQTASGRFLSQLVSNGGTDVEHFVGTREVTGLRRDGSKFPAELSLAHSHHGGAVVYTGILRDTTERAKAAAATKAVATHDAEVNQLRSMNEFKTRFLNMAAHELNTPLTPLRLQLHLLKAGEMGDLNERQAKAVGLLDRNVTRLAGLVTEILEVARLQSGRLKLSAAPVAIDEITDEVLESFAETARRVGVDLTFAGQQNLFVLADRNRLTQVLFNLVSNALKFTPAGGKVTVEAAPHHDQIEVSVRDTGLGMTQDQMDRLFQPFTQVHDPMAVTTTGTGLGLYICKGLLEIQGGSIRCSSAGPGRGSTFRFTLPIGDAAVATVRVPPVTEDPLVRRLRELI